jgi:hypothetical protein
MYTDRLERVGMWILDPASLSYDFSSCFIEFLLCDI